MVLLNIDLKCYHCKIKLLHYVDSKEAPEGYIEYMCTQFGCPNPQNVFLKWDIERVDYSVGSTYLQRIDP